MYIRFTTTYRNSRGYARTGVFQALSFLARNESTFEYDRENINEIRNWFGKYLDRPNRLSTGSGQASTSIPETDSPHLLFAGLNLS